MGSNDTTNDVFPIGILRQGETGTEDPRRFFERKIGKITNGEHLLIWRKREGLTQQELSKKLGISLKDLRICERDKTRVMPFSPKIDNFLNRELCLILRIRSGKTIRQCAKEAGVSRYWFNEMELGKAPEQTLVNYWKKNAV